MAPFKALSIAPVAPPGLLTPSNRLTISASHLILHMSPDFTSIFNCPSEQIYYVNIHTINYTLNVNFSPIPIIIKSLLLFLNKKLQQRVNSFKDVASQETLIGCLSLIMLSLEFSIGYLFAPHMHYGLEEVVV